MPGLTVAESASEPHPRSPEGPMGNARTKLNVAYLNGCLLVSAIFGWVAQSWAVFLAALAVTVGCGVYGGEIRPSAGRR